MAFAYQTPTFTPFNQLPMGSIAPAFLSGARMVQEPAQNAIAIQQARLNAELAKAINPYKIASAERENAIAPLRQQIERQQLNDALSSFYDTKMKQGIKEGESYPSTPAPYPPEKKSAIEGVIPSQESIQLPTSAETMFGSSGSVLDYRPTTDQEKQDSLNEQIAKINKQMPDQPVYKLPSGREFNPMQSQAEIDKRNEHQMAIDKAKLSHANQLSLNDQIFKATTLEDQKFKHGMERDVQRQAASSKMQSERIAASKEIAEEKMDAQSDLAKYKAATSLETGKAKMAQKATDSIRNQPEVKEYWVTSREYDNMTNAWEVAKNTGNYAGVDQSIINQLNRMENPGSIVRQAAYKVTDQETALFNSLQAKWTKMFEGGESITDAERANFVQLAIKYHDVSAKNAASAIAPFYQNLTVGQGIPPETYLGTDLLKLAPNSGATRNSGNVQPALRPPIPRGSIPGSTSGVIDLGDGFTLRPK